VDTDELMADVCPKIAKLGSTFYFQPETLGCGKDLGLDGFRFYFLGRGGALGDVEPAVVVSAFGYFAPSLVERMWTTAREKQPPRQTALAYTDCAGDLGRSALADVDGLAAFCDAAEQAAAAADPAGLTLFAAWTTMPLAGDAPARAMQLTALLRELRGSAHLAAVRACGLSGQIAHLIKRPAEYTNFGWSEPAPEVTDDQRARHAEAEARTDDILRPAYGVLDEAAARALAAGIGAIDARLGQG
jgi:hypothetical protein